MSRRSQQFEAIRTEGGLLPPDFLRKALDPNTRIAGIDPASYGLAAGERITEAVTQSWTRLRKHWVEFKALRSKISEKDAGTSVTNDKWTLPLLRELAFGVLPATTGPTLEGQTYAISRFLGPTPIHLVGSGLSLDRRAEGVRGAARSNPHGLVQEFLNRSPGHTWGIVSNGLKLRVLRDNQSLSRQAYLEFDLETMFEGEIYSDFVLLWLFGHATRFQPREGERSDSCWLEEWTKIAQEQGTRALETLRGGVEQALQIFGRGFVAHPKNANLRERLRTGQLPLSAFHNQLLRIIYRLIFLFVAEDRELDGAPLLHPHDSSLKGREARQKYAAHYSTRRLRDLAHKIRGSRHGDLWCQFQIVIGALSGEPQFQSVRDFLALPILGSMLWSPEATAAINGESLGNDGMGIELSNADFLDAIRHLAYTRQEHAFLPVDYRNLGPEEFGSVYEGLLSLTPQIRGDGAEFYFQEFAGNQRKTSGSFYTPDSLVQCLLDSALEPVVAERLKEKKGQAAEAAILGIKMCDPAVGSGHFLIGAAHRLARHLARVRAIAEGETEPGPDRYQHALRDVIGHCLYGVDMNPMAVELCKVILWLEALEPGRPLSFLDHHIRQGNSLLGTTPELIANGIIEDAFNPIEGDDKKICAAFKKQNKAERLGQQDMFYQMVAEPTPEYLALRDRVASLDAVDDNALDGIREKETRFRALGQSPEYKHAKLVADAYCAAFVWKKTTEFQHPITHQVFGQIKSQPKSCPEWLLNEVDRLAKSYSFFHWHVAFPEVDAKGGFDVVMGNPPWERVKLQEIEWFAVRRPQISQARNAAERKRLIEVLTQSNNPVDQSLFAEFLEAKRKADGESHLMRNAGAYPLCGRGDINVYSIFAESMRNRIAKWGRVGAVLPSGLATDDTTKLYFQDLMSSSTLVSFFEFENEGFFPDAGQGHMLRFALTTICGSGIGAIATKFMFQGKKVEQLQDANLKIPLTVDDIALLNPNTLTCPIFRSRTDAELTRVIYRRVPVLVREGPPEENPWGVSFSRMFDMATDSSQFKTKQQLESDNWILSGNAYRKGKARYLPLYEAKMLHQFNHRYGDYAFSAPGDRPHVLPRIKEEILEASDYSSIPFYWVSEEAVRQATPQTWSKGWFMGWRDVTDARASARTLIACAIPSAGVGDKFLLIFSNKARFPFLYSNLNSFALDYVARQKVSGLALKYFTMRQLAILPPNTYDKDCPWSDSTLARWIAPRLAELAYSAIDMHPFAEELGIDSPPFKWNVSRRSLLRCEIDAAYFHLYLGEQNEWQRQSDTLARMLPSPRDAVSYVMDTFPIVKRKDEEEYGSYRTKDMILEIYDALSESTRTKRPYKTRLNPPPADPSCCHETAVNHGK